MDKHHSWIRIWGPETASTALSIGLLACIIAILKAYDGKPQPELSSNLTLNGLIQFLAAITQFSFSYPLARALGQLKWLWFLPSDARPLQDFEAYDEACRGSWGSLQLVFRLRGSGIRNKLVTQVAALVLASAILSGPFTQQALKFDMATLSPSPNGTAVLKRVTSMSRTANGQFTVLDSDTLSIRSAIFHAAQAMLDPHQQTIAPLQPNCSTESCSWEPYTTIGICSKIVNITATNATGIQQNENFTMFLLDKFFNTTSLFSMPESQDPEVRAKITSIFEPMNYVFIYPAMDPTVLQTLDMARASSGEFIVAYSDGNVDMITEAKRVNLKRFKFLAVQFFYCTKALETIVGNGVTETKELGSAIQVVSSTVKSMNYFWNTDMTSYIPEQFESPCPPVLMNQSLSLAPPPGYDQGKSFVIDACTGLVGASDLLMGIVGEAIFVNKGGYLANTGILAGPVSLALHGGPNTHTIEPETQWKNMRLLIDNVADSLTNMMRESATSFVGNDNGIVEGIAFSRVPLIRIRWRWMALMIAQVLLTIVIVAVVIQMTSESDMEARKDSSIAGLCAVDAGLKAEIGQFSDLSGMKKRSRKLKVRLDKTTGGYQLCLDGAALEAEVREVRTMCSGGSEKGGM